MRYALFIRAHSCEFVAEKRVVESFTVLLFKQNDSNVYSNETYK